LPACDGDPLALEEDLHGAAGEPPLDLGAGEAVGDAVKVPGDIDVVVDADTAHTPFGEDIGFAWQGLERGPIELFEQLPPRRPEPADRSLLIELVEQLADRRVQLGQAIEPAMAQPRQIHRSTMRTAASTLALSRGRCGRVGSTAVP
jgi:hypothetical protein